MEALEERLPLAVDVQLLTDFGLPTDHIQAITPVGDGATVFFTAWTPEEGMKVWKSDGTEIGTTLVKVIQPDVSRSYATSPRYRIAIDPAALRRGE